MGIPPIEVILLVLAAGAAGWGLSLLVRSTAQTVGATIFGGVLVAVGTYNTIQVTREGQVTARLTQAVTQLDAKNRRGKRNEVVVLGGIYALERIAANSRADYQTIMEILTSFVRTCVPLPEDGASKDEESIPELPNDVQAALAVLARRTPLRRILRLDLRWADLRKAKLPHAHLESQELRLDLQATNLRKAKLPHAHFQNALLCRADLREADLRGADLRGADLGGAKLQRAKYDANTKWPEGFDQDAAGAVLAGRSSGVLS